MTASEWTPEKIAEVQRRDAEYRARLAPASDAEILQVAGTLWASPALQAIFKRVGYDGDMTEDEIAAVYGALDACRQGALWDRDDLHLALAPPLLRQLASGRIDNLDCPEVHAFLDACKVQRGGILIRSMPTTARDVIEFAKAARSDPAVWTLYHPRALTGEPLTWEEGDRMIETFNGSMARYRWKRGYFNLNSAALSQAKYLLWDLAAGKIDSLDSAEALARAREGKFVKD